MLCREEGPGADDILQELDGEVHQLVISLEVLAVLGDPVPQDGEHSHRGRRTCDRHLPLGGFSEGVVRYFLERESETDQYLSELEQTFTEVGRSLGLLDPAVATAKATAAVAELDLGRDLGSRKVFSSVKRILDRTRLKSNNLFHFVMSKKFYNYLTFFTFTT